MTLLQAFVLHTGQFKALNGYQILLFTASGNIQNYE